MQVGKLEINSEFKFSYQLFLAGRVFITHILMLSEFSTLTFPFRPGRKINDDSSIKSNNNGNDTRAANETSGQ